jgi:hypothetical protein
MTSPLGLNSQRAERAFRSYVYAFRRVELMGDPGLLYFVAVVRDRMEGGSDEDAFHISGRSFAPRIRDDH